MLSTRNFIGQAVLLRGGRVLGSVGDAVIDPHREQVLAWLVNPSAQAPEAVVLPLEAVFELGPDHLTVTACDDLVALRRLPRVEAAWRRGLHLGHTPLMSGDVVLGTLHDVHFDVDSQQITLYDVLPSGRRHPVQVAPEQVRCTGAGVWEAGRTAQALF